jgi:hypothetical protein
LEGKGEMLIIVSLQGLQIENGISGATVCKHSFLLGVCFAGFDDEKGKPSVFLSQLLVIIRGVIILLRKVIDILVRTLSF